MKKWSEIKQATLDKLFLDESEAEQQGYKAKFQYLANECLDFISNGVKPKIASFVETTTDKDAVVELPDDFLSFADLTNYLKIDDHCLVENPDIVYLTNNQIKLPCVGTYTIYYNARWSDITTNDIKTDATLEVPASVLNCLPSYMASQLLSQDDMQRSAILKNEFELMLSRLDTDMMIQEKHFKSIGGWY